MTKVFVGLSGGVDSSVSASLLVDAGYEVTGVYMKNWSEDLPGMRCPWAEDLADAKRVAVELGIDFKVYDFEKDYRAKVVQYMLDEYRLGRTPNPDVMCNQEIKFKLFLETALSDGADMVATGHYAKTERINDKKAKLLQARDQKKDQTYFLYRISSEALAKTLFPIGDLEKTEVRKIAEARGLVTARKKDSVGICFVGQVGIEEFLSEYIETKPGEIIEIDTGKKLGWHKGSIYYTIGQRHGLDVGGGLPYYVVSKDIDKNLVFVSRNLNQKEMWSEQIVLKDLHWMNNVPKVQDNLQIRIRHLAPLVPASIKSIDSDSATLILSQAIRAVAPGQSVAVYDGQVCLGGGIIK